MSVALFFALFLFICFHIFCRRGRRLARNQARICFAVKINKTSILTTNSHAHETTK